MTSVWILRKCIFEMQYIRVVTLLQQNPDMGKFFCIKNYVLSWLQERSLFRYFQSTQYKKYKMCTLTPWIRTGRLIDSSAIYESTFGTAGKNIYFWRFQSKTSPTFDLASRAILKQRWQARGRGRGRGRVTQMPTITCMVNSWTNGVRGKIHKILST